MPLDRPRVLAAIDLGSNSFHLAVGRFEQGEIRLQESLSEKVQLRAGLGEDGCLSAEAIQRGLECLGRFAQRLESIADSDIRVVGTNTLRESRNARQFISLAEHLLGRDIEIIAGREEARLIYLGVAHSLPMNSEQRLVVDIGGGSTEFIIGQGFDAIETESLHLGCVSYTLGFFADGRITDGHFSRAVLSARHEIATIQKAYRARGWSEVIGASGTIRAIAQVCEANGWSQNGISRNGLEKIRRRLVRAGQVQNIELKGLKEDRQGIFPAGVAVLLAIFEQLGIDQMTAAEGALREGVLYDLVGRELAENVRERSVHALCQRYRVQMNQAERVAETALQLWQQAGVWRDSAPENWRELLRWAALMHEVGLAVSHSQYHRHSAYLIRHSDLSGFSNTEQEIMSLLVAGHRRRLKKDRLAEWAEREQKALLYLTLILRLAASLHRARSEEPLPMVELAATERSLKLKFPRGWLRQHPLTEAELADQQGELQQVGIAFNYS